MGVKWVRDTDLSPTREPAPGSDGKTTAKHPPVWDRSAATLAPEGKEMQGTVPVGKPARGATAILDLGSQTVRGDLGIGEDAAFEIRGHRLG